MRSNLVRAATAAVVFVSAGTAFGQQLAFSGADGAGALATGGRGGVVYHVTRLDGEINGNRTVAGTLAYGLSDGNFKNADGSVIPRTIVFDVGGTIFLGRKGDSLGWDTQSPLSAGSNITIAGQTAPGGINIVGAGLKVNGTNAIVRHLTIAPGYGSRTVNGKGSGYYDQYVFDGMNIHAANVIVDHVSTPFATDEGISADEVANNVTVQYSTIANGQNYPQQDAEPNVPGGIVFKGHALGSLWQPSSNAKTSLLHNLYANEGGRTPRFGTESGKLTTVGVGAVNDFRNNVVYNWLGTGGGGASGQPFSANFVGNYYRAGPGGEGPGTAVLGSDGKYTVPITTTAGGEGIFAGNDTVNSKVYQSGNVKDINKNATAEFTTSVSNADFASSNLSATSAFGVPLYGLTESAQLAYNRVIAYVGANWQNRSVVDAGIINGVQTGTGKIIALADPTHGTDWNYLLSLKQNASGVAPFNRPANFDTDRDGLPDVWEAAHGLDPTAASNNGDYDNNGFTNLEEYLNELGTIPAPAPLVFTNNEANARFARIGNWTVGTSTGAWLPSRFDEVQINGGAAAVDSVGQHAGTVRVSTATGQTAALNVSAGWIDVAQTLAVGQAGLGSVAHSGGVVKASAVVLGGTATNGNGVGHYALNGGTLATPLLTRNNTASTFTMTGGILHADRVTFSFTNNGGTLAPGGDVAVQLIAASGLADLAGVAPVAAASVGTTTVNGDLTLASGILAIDLASATAFDRLAVDGTLTLGGNLTITLLDGYTAPAGTEWRIATAASITGTFAPLPPEFAIRTTGNGELYLTALTAVPEPSAMTFAVTALIGLRRRRHRANLGRLPD